jgi:hypothetical protein
MSKRYGWKDGKNIVQEGKDNDGNFMRWTFEDITEKSFHWRHNFSDRSTLNQS